VLRLVLIDALGAVVLLVLWYFYFARFNRRRGAVVLRWVESACSSRGRIVESRWVGVSRLQARLGLGVHWFENAHITVRLRPRPLLLMWLFSIWRKQSETLTFEADLDHAPTFQLEVFRHRWFSHRHSAVAVKWGDWEVSRPGPVVLTTRTHWTQEFTPVVNSLMTSRGHNLLTVRFRPDSPHLAATIPLEALSNEQGAASFLNIVEELAAGASTHRR
jgi:hypothetical protein